MRYFIYLSYKGTKYFGWQRQPNVSTVQESIETALSTILRQPISLTGCGRTDTGVHASYYVAHFDTADRENLDSDFIYHLNCFLDQDIAIQKIEEVGTEAHARFDAKEREYTYHILLSKNPFNRDLTWQYQGQLDIEKMNFAASYLLTHSDFETFSKVGSDNKTTICKVFKAQWKQNNDSLIFTIRADRFLRNMIRSIVGTLFDVGRGKISPDDFLQILESQDRSKASSSAPAQGLFLSDIKY